MRIFVKKEVYEFRNYFNPIAFLYSRICHDFMHTYKKNMQILFFAFPSYILLVVHIVAQHTN